MRVGVQVLIGVGEEGKAEGELKGRDVGHDQVKEEDGLGHWREENVGSTVLVGGW
jgi:hypothetical protein